MKKIILLMLGCCVQMSVMAQGVTAHHAATHHKHHAVAHHKAQPAVKWKHSGTSTVAKDDHAAYEGKPSESNDGVNKNKQRNINTNVPVQLAPVTGNNSR